MAKVRPMKTRQEGDTMTVVLSKEVLRQFKAKCAEAGVTMREQVEQLVEKWLTEKGVRV